MSSPDDARSISQGQILRTTRLGSVAMYRVCEVRDGFVEVEVVEAPGLRTGSRFRFTVGAVASMEQLPTHSNEPSASSLPAHGLSSA